MKAFCLLVLSLVAAVDYTASLYIDDACSLKFHSQAKNFSGTCAELLADEIAKCEDWTFSDSSLCMDTMALNTCFTNPYVNDVLGIFSLWMYYDCEDEVIKPTYAPEEATCDDGIQNGDEAGVDCGGTYCEPCPESCSTFQCTSYGEKYTLKDDAGDYTCAQYPCNAGDIDTCCITRATCFTLGVGSCLSGDVLISKANSTYCAGIVCDVFDRETCCTEAGNCMKFKLCDKKSHYLRENPELLKCGSEVCGEADISTCCADKATCDTYTCDYYAGLTAVDDNSNVYCKASVCSDEDSDVCCIDDDACFSADGKVETLSRGVISLSELEVGDYVRENLKGYTKVVGFLHHDMFVKHDFLELATNGSKIVVTKEHLLATEYGFTQAKDVKPGMSLMAVNNFPEEVVRVGSVTKTGVIAPLTESGVLSVNGFQVSCYAYIPGQLHWLVDFLMWPRKQFGWSQDGIDVYAIILNIVLYLPWKLTVFL